MNPPSSILSTLTPQEQEQVQAQAKEGREEAQTETGTGTAEKRTEYLSWYAGKVASLLRTPYFVNVPPQRVMNEWRDIYLLITCY